MSGTTNNVGSILSCTDFRQLLVHQEPIYADMLLEDIRPTDNAWPGHYATGLWPAHQGVEHRLDRINHVWPNTTKVWTPKQLGDCLGTPCDKTEHCIGWGSERITYGKEQQSWATPLICIDQDMDVTHSEEQFEYIITDILRPATAAITSMFLRKRTLANAGHRYYISNTGALVEWTFAWTTTGGNEEWVLDTSVPPTCGKLVPQALQRQFQPLMQRGYAGKNPFSETAPFIDLVADIETTWELDRLGGSTGVGGTPSVAGNWRFTEWNAASAYWRYGFSGQIGNFMVRTDWAGLRFNYLGEQGASPNVHRYQLILPFRNDTAAGAGGGAGLKSVDNPDFQNALYTISFITHKKGLMLLTADMTSLNPEMPFMIRDLGGKWQFVMHDLGTDVNGCVIENKRGNKGQFIADFELAIRPMYTEFIIAYFHKREPMCVPWIDVCSESPGYPLQSVSSCAPGCD